MRKHVLAILALTVFASPAYAKDALEDNALCKLRAKHVAASDVAFKPGVDVKGNPVTPADINAAPPMVPDIIRIPMTIDLAKHLDIVPKGVELKAGAGMVEIFKNGDVAYNGVDISDQTAALCDGKAEEVPAPTPASAPAAVLPPQTLGQITVPAPAAPQAVPAPAAPAVEPVNPVERTNEELQQDDKIIWGEGN